MSRRRHRRTHRRFLSLETLEGRRLLVNGIGEPVSLPQNPGNPEDTNYDGEITPGDVLRVINELNNPNSTGSPTSFSTDVDGDGTVTPRDALLIINRINSRSDTSSVAPQQRAIGLRRALDAGILPPKMSLPEAQELLETLENGGHYEAGERYRNGQMLNIKDQPKDSSGAVSGVAPIDNNAVPQPVDSASENLDTAMIDPEPAEENDPFALLDSIDETFADPLHEPVTPSAFVDASGGDETEAVARLATQLSEQLTERLAADTAAQIAEAIAAASHTVESAAHDIVDDVATVRTTLGDAPSQIAQLFASVDIGGIVEQIRVDLGTLAEAAISNDLPDSPDRAWIFARFVSRDYLHGLGENSP